MKKIVALLVVFVLVFGSASSALAHSGKTDKRGGHKCSAKSKSKGLCYGYHYHTKKR